MSAPLPVSVTPAARTAVRVLAVALPLGVFGDLALRGMPWGLNVALSIVALVAAGAGVPAGGPTAIRREAQWLALLAVSLGCSYARRDSDMLAFCNLVAIACTLAWAAAAARGSRIRTLSPREHFHAVADAAVNCWFGALPLVARDVPWSALAIPGRRRLASALVGVALGIPLLAVFGALFASADPVFGTFASRAVRVDPAVVLSHGILTGVWGGIVAGFLAFALLPAPRTPLRMHVVPDAPRLDPLTVAVPLALVTTLFLLFVLVELRYFFGGAGRVAAIAGLTYAEYARSGFFELLGAAGLVVPCLLAGDRALREAPEAGRRAYRRLAAGLLVLVGVIVVSALERMRLYVRAYGLSEIRLYATVAMVYVTFVAAWLAATVLRGRREHFSFGAVVAAYTLLAGLNLTNPDALIVRTNLDRGSVAQPFDAKYAVSLGADAIPTLVAAWPRLDAATRCDATHALLARWRTLPAGDWRSWNWARSRELRLRRAFAPTLEATTCAAPETPR
ncbi:MAG TPA: DUF4173 domain-containing protein [Gemmatimonadales bacterium]